MYIRTQCALAVGVSAELPNKKYIEQLRYEINKSVVVGDLAREINFKQICQKVMGERLNN